MLLFLLIVVVGGLGGVGYLVYDSFVHFPELWWEAPWFIKVLSIAMFAAGYHSMAWKTDA